MKKLLIVPLLALLLPVASFAQVIPEGCLPGYNFSTTTGKKCEETSYVSYSDMAKTIAEQSVHIIELENQVKILLSQKEPAVESKTQEIERRILDLRKDYLDTVNAIRQEPISLFFQEGKIKKLTEETNIEIEKLQIQLKIETMEKNKLNEEEKAQKKEGASKEMKWLPASSSAQA